MDPTVNPDLPVPGRIRASDAEREEFAKIVRDAVGQGRLTLDEGDKRLATVYATRYRDELRPLVADLPHERPREGAVERSHGYPGRPGYLRRRGGPGPLLLVVVLIGAIWAVSSGRFWPAIPFIVLGFFVVRGLVRAAVWSRYSRDPRSR